MESSQDGIQPGESPPAGLSDAELAAEQLLIARRHRAAPAGPAGVPTAGTQPVAATASATAESGQPMDSHVPGQGWPSDATRVLPAIPAASITPEPSNPAVPSARVSSAAQHHPVAITCPECSASAMVELTRRDALDFCARCDFPLFWARDQVVVSDPMDSNDDALRRLPGTLGRVVIASLPCPHCNEPNLPTATLCVRCGLTLKASAPPSPPRPRPVPLPEPPLEPLEDEPDHWWIWLLVLLTLLLVAGIVLLAAQPWN
jgi:hypothetical protein